MMLLGIAIFDLPIGTMIQYNNIQHSIILRQSYNEFVGIKDIPTSIERIKDDDDDDDNDTDYKMQLLRQQEQKQYPLIHFITIQGCSNSNNNPSYSDSSVNTTVITGFFLCGYDNNESHNTIESSLLIPNVDNNNNNNNQKTEWLIRQYNNHIEEVSSRAVDPLTVRHFLQQVNTMDPKRMISYPNWMMSLTKLTSTTKQDQQGHEVLEKEWYQLTNSISLSLLKRRGNIQWGDKIIPSMYQDDSNDINDYNNTIENKNNTNNQYISNNDNDIGKMIQYPSIPIFIIIQTSSSKTTKLNIPKNHMGTKQFISCYYNQPNDRTQLFVYDIHPIYTIIQKVLLLYYNNNTPSSVKSIIKSTTNDDDNNMNNNNNNMTIIMMLIGDIQLSFILFIHLQCYQSYQHWKDLIILLCSIEYIGLQEIYMNQLYQSFILVLIHQFQYIMIIQQNDSTATGSSSTLIDDLFGNNDNNDDDSNIFLYNSIQYLYNTIHHHHNTKLTTTNENDMNTSSHAMNKLQRMISKLYRIVQSFTVSYSSTPVSNSSKLHNDDDDDDDDRCNDDNNDVEIKLDNDDEMMTNQSYDHEQHENIHHVPQHQKATDSNNIISGNNNNNVMNDKTKDRMDIQCNDDDDDDEGPVIVSFEDMKESYERIQQYDQQQQSLDRYRTIQELPIDNDDNDDNGGDVDEGTIQQQYPLLYASMKSTNGIEDIMMTCSRILYEPNDISLVREATSFLQQQEQQQQQKHGHEDNNKKTRTNKMI